MDKGQLIGFKASAIEIRALRELARQDERTRSDMLRWLIRAEARRRGLPLGQAAQGDENCSPHRLA